jgi:hypothetical protein
MQIRIRTSGAVMYEAEFRQLYASTSFPQQISEQTFNDFGADVVLEGPQASPTRYQRAYADGVEQIDGKWFTKFSVADMDDETKIFKDAEQAASVRTSRNDKLKDCDWTQIADSTADKAAWATYRQALRDMTTQEGFPWTITWPALPT